MLNRRTLLRAGALSVPTVLAGCTGDTNDSGTVTTTTTAPAAEDPGTSTPTATETTTAATVTNVAVGPERRLRFEPESVEISTGTTIVWTAESQGHNVSSKPDANRRCENPEGAEPFASYEGDDHYATMEVGDTFEHEFTVAGEYTYVCVPHAGQGMVGTITVTG